MECLKIRHVLLFTDLGHSNTLCSHMQISVSILWYCVLDNGPLLSQKEYKVQYPMLGRPLIPSNYYSFWYSIFLISNPCSVLLSLIVCKCCWGWKIERGRESIECPVLTFWEGGRGGRLFCYKLQPGMEIFTKNYYCWIGWLYKKVAHFICMYFNLGFNGLYWLINVKVDQFQR